MLQQPTVSCCSTACSQTIFVLNKKLNFFQIYLHIYTEDIQPDLIASVTYLSSLPVRDGSDCGSCRNLFSFA